jgi:hypothetical protein
MSGEVWKFSLLDIVRSRYYLVSLIYLYEQYFQQATCYANL